MIYAINYADANFEKVRKFNTKTAYSKGQADKVIEYSPSDLDEEFVKKNKKILSYKRGVGLWLWKPYVILKTLKQIDEGDYLFYCDAGAIYVNKIQYLIDCMEKYQQSIMLFELPLLERQFTKKETFYFMNYDDYEQNQILAGYILLKKNSFSESFISEWLTYCEDERILSPKYFLDNIDEFEDFVAHREDQSVLSILVRKHNLPVFRDPSNFGDRPWQYASNEWSFKPKKYLNSNYPKIIISNRKADPQKYLVKERIKTILNKIGIYNQKVFFIKNSIYQKTNK